MSDLRELAARLIDHPVVPVPPLPAIVERAHLLRRRRRAMAAAPVALLVLVSTAVVLADAHSGSQRSVRTVDHAPTATTAASGPETEQWPTGGEPDSAPERSVARPSGEPASGTTSSSVSPPVPTPYAHVPKGDAAPAKGCAIEGSWFAKRSHVSQYPRCSFTATEPAGFHGYGEWWMTVERPDGSTYGYCHREARPQRDTDYSTQCSVAHPQEMTQHMFPVPRSCGPVGFIQPGDKVSVWVHDGGHADHGGDHGDPPTFKAGPDNHC